MIEITVFPDKSKVVVSRVVDGVVTAREKIDPDVRSQRVRAGKSVGATETELLGWAVTARRDGAEVVIPVITAPVERHAIVVRGFRETREQGVRYEVTGAEFVRGTLQSVPLDALIDWTDGDTLCCLDVDYHDRAPPPRDWLENLVRTKLTPAPHAWHFSRGGGLHCFYTQAAPFTATELAAAAALRFKASDPSAGVELKKIVRGPGEEGVSVAGAQMTSVVLSAAGGKDEADPEEVAAYLDERGWKVGGRYDHTVCPIHPTPGDAGTNNPVTVNADGVFCYACQAKGRHVQRGKPGHASWGALLGNPVADDVGSMVRGLCHWGHAKYVLVHKYGFPEALAKIAYVAACKAYHRDRPTQELAPLVAGTRDTEEFTRVGPVWSKIPQAHSYAALHVRDHLATLPACMVMGDQGPKVVRATVAEFAEPVNLADRGFPDIEVVHGFRVAKQYLPQGRATVVAVPHQALRDANCSPAYVPRTKRVPEAKAWDVLTGVFAGLDTQFIKVILCAFGCAQETKAGMNPIVFVHGSSGYGKSSTLKIAAGIYGASIGEVVYTDDDTRFRAGIWEAAQSGPGVVVDEILKTAARGRTKRSAREALDPFLTLTPDSTSHKLYHGHIKFGRVPAVFLTEPRIPQYMAAETQLARRIREWQLEGRKYKWMETVQAAGVSFKNLATLRLASREINAACDSVLSEVVDEFFAVPMSWDDMANRLGCKTLETSDQFTNPAAQQAEFYRLVCEVPEIESPRLKKIFAPGFKEIDRNSQNELVQDLCAVYSQFADDGDWLKSRSLENVDWSTLLKVDKNVSLDLLSNGVSVFARFRVGPVKNPLRVNREITTSD